jgi:hypothetical protein
VPTPTEIAEIADQRVFDYAAMGQDVYAAYTSYAGRLREQKDRIRRLDGIMNDVAPVKYPDGKVVTSELRVGNSIKTNIGRVAKSVGRPNPTIVVPPWGPSEKAEQGASKIASIVRNYYEANPVSMPKLRTRLGFDLSGAGMAALVIWPDYKTSDPARRFPLFRRLDPRTVYPDPSIFGGDVPNRLISRYTAKLYELTGVYGPSVKDGLFTDNERRSLKGTEEVEVVEYYDDKVCIKFATRQVNRGNRRYVVLSRLENLLGKPLFVIGLRDSFDNQPRGQFDGAINVLITRNEIETLHLSDLGERVYSQPIIYGGWQNPQDLGSPDIPLVPTGGPQESLVTRVPTAQHNPQVYADFQVLVEEEATASAVSAAAGGRVDQSIISAAAVNALQNTDNNEREDYLLTISQMLEQANSIALEVEERYLATDDAGQPVKKALSPSVTGSKKAEMYSPSEDINGHYENKVMYGEMAAFDELNRQAAVIQRQQVGHMSRRRAMQLLSKGEDIFEEESQIFQEQVVDGVTAAIRAPVGTPGAATMEQRLLAGKLADEGKTPWEIVVALAEQQGQAAPTIEPEAGLTPDQVGTQQLSLVKGGAPGTAEGQPAAPLPSMQELGIG